MEIQAAIAKIDKFSSNEEGNKVEIIERPNGGVSIVMAEGTLGGSRSKGVTMKAVHSVLNLIGEGVPDGASARVVLQRIRDEHREIANVNISIISCDLQSNTIVITKNNPVPILIYEEGESHFLPLSQDAESRRYDPMVYQFEFQLGQTFILLSEGVENAGIYNDNKIDLLTALGAIYDDDNDEPSVQDVADNLLNQAIGHDSDQPRDDMTVVVLKVSPATTRNIRREYVSFPIKKNIS
ncbi:MAG: SpoIIE family protein phosphatase [Anaerolineaceae bacterium]|jgi:serine phosphatase RsbU (regulator of sigma subunit)|nr:SpoIIE family protein phosphatase [Anaerolineaceae bacterium]MDD4042064.1 SpoIIE family protein phosphatase [Anaerolineaceae bacterium]MDD4578689.1 SpoIIE family protein phosphatase [Anaerolineaceae bacterium]